jgi:hypothetical protein
MQGQRCLISLREAALERGAALLQHMAVESLMNAWQGTGCWASIIHTLSSFAFSV